MYSYKDLSDITDAIRFARVLLHLLLQLFVKKFERYRLSTSHYEGTRCIFSNKLAIRYVLHCFADCHCGKKGITNENVVFI